MKIRGQTISTPTARHAVADDTAVSKEPWSSKNTVDKLCPDLVEEGPAVRCEPVADYPLEVVSTLKPQDSYQNITLKHCGKNILDIATAGVYHNNTSTPHVDMYVTETGLRLETLNTISTSNWTAWGFCLGTVKELAGKTITVSGKAKTSITGVQLPWLNIGATNVEPTTVREKPRYEDGGYAAARKTLVHSNGHSGHAVATYTVTGEEEYKYIGVFFQLTYGGSYVVGDWTQWSDIQVEIGNNATAYEPYKGQTFTADFTNAPSMIEGASYNWNTGYFFTGESEYWHDPATGNFYDTAESEVCIHRKIPAFPGVNTLYSDCGDTEVKGKADPVKIIEKLTNAIIALGGNV